MNLEVETKLEIDAEDFMRLVGSSDPVKQLNVYYAAAALSPFQATFRMRFTHKGAVATLKYASTLREDGTRSSREIEWELPRRLPRQVSVQGLPFEARQVLELFGVSEL